MGNMRGRMALRIRRTICPGNETLHRPKRVSCPCDAASERRECLAPEENGTSRPSNGVSRRRKRLSGPSKAVSQPWQRLSAPRQCLTHGSNETLSRVKALSRKSKALSWPRGCLTRGSKETFSPAKALSRPSKPLSWLPGCLTRGSNETFWRAKALSRPSKALSWLPGCLPRGSNETIWRAKGASSDAKALSCESKGLRSCRPGGSVLTSTIFLRSTSTPLSIVSTDPGTDPIPEARRDSAPMQGAPASVARRSEAEGQPRRPAPAD